MAAGLRNIKIRFVGDAKDVGRAARDAAGDIRKVARAAAGATADVGAGIASSISGALEALPPQGKLVAGVLTAGLAAAMAPAVGAAVSSAVLLGVGGGALALGIKAAADAPAVKAAFKGLKKTATSVFDDFGKPFEKPLADLGTSLGGTLKNLRPDIQEIGKIIAPVLERLGPAIDGFAKNAMPGIKKAVEGAVPLFNTLADKLPGIGESIGIFFEKISSNSDDTTTFFGDLLDAIGWIIEAIGTVISWLTSFYIAVRDQVTAAQTAFVMFKIKLLEVFGDILSAARNSLSWIPGLDDKLKVAEEKFAQFRRDANAELAMIKSQYEIAITARLTTLGFKTDSPGQFTGRAIGGPVRAGGIYKVGEHGPEIIRMEGNGYVHNARETAQMTSDGGVTEVHVHLSDAVTQVTRYNNRDLKRRTRARSGLAL